VRWHAAPRRRQTRSRRRQAPAAGTRRTETAAAGHCGADAAVEVFTFRRAIARLARERGVGSLAATSGDAGPASHTSPLPWNPAFGVFLRAPARLARGPRRRLVSRNIGRRGQASSARPCAGTPRLADVKRARGEREAPAVGTRRTEAVVFRCALAIGLT